MMSAITTLHQITMVDGPQTIALVPDHMVLAHSTGKEDYIHLQQEVGQMIQIHVVLYQASHPISRQSDFRVKAC